jgi:hypothetical protein
VAVAPHFWFVGNEPEVTPELLPAKHERDTLHHHNLPVDDWVWIFYDSSPPTATYSTTMTSHLSHLTTLLLCSYSMARAMLCVLGVCANYCSVAGGYCCVLVADGGWAYKPYRQQDRTVLGSRAVYMMLMW